MWHSIDIDTILKKLNTKINGLTHDEALERIRINGKNELPTNKKNCIYKIILGELSNPILLLLIFTIIVSFILKEYTDSIVILFIVIVDLILGTYQEYKAEKTMEALSNLVNLEASVIRDSKQIVIDSTNLVVGDIILFDSGDKVSADVRIIDSSN